MKIKISDFKKVVFTKPKDKQEADQQKQEQQESGGGGGEQSSAPPDVEMYDPYASDKEPGEEGKEGEGKEGEGKEGKEGEGKEGEGKKGEGEGKEGEGKEGEGEGKGKGEGEGQGKGSGSPDSQTRDQIEKGAAELLDKLNKANNLPVSPCGSNAKRSDKQKSSDPVERDKIEQQAEIKRKQIEEILQKAAEEGHEHVFTQRGRGTGGKNQASSAPQGDAVPIKMRKPEFLRKIAKFASKEYEKEYYKKGVDWFYTQGFGDIMFKAKPKISVPQKFVYIMVDVSGSMFGDFDGTGKSLLEHLLGYLPVIAEEFKGQVWWISNGLLEFQDGSPGITLLSDYKGMSTIKQSEYFDKVKNAKGAGGGTTFAVELQAVQDLREGKMPDVVKEALKGKLLKMIGKPQKHMASIIMLTDSYIDNPETEYTWKGKTVIGNLPPSTIVMTDEQGCKYMNSEFPEDFKNKELRIECYDITENGKYKLGKKRK